MRISAIADGQMKLRRSPFGFVQTHREVDRLFLIIKRLPFRARLNVPAAHRDKKGCTLPTDHPLVWHRHSLPRSVCSNAIGIRPLEVVGIREKLPELIVFIAPDADTPLDKVRRGHTFATTVQG